MGALSDSILGRLLRPFSRILYPVAGSDVPQETWMTMRIGAGLAWVNSAANQWGELIVDTSAAQTFASATVGNLAVTGTITQGPAITKTGTGTSTGPGAATVLTLPLPNNHIGLLDLRVVGRASGVGAAAIAWVAQALDVEAGTMTGAGADPIIVANSFGLPVGLQLPTWAAGVLTISVRGPTDTITSAGANAGHVRLTVAGPVTGDITGKSVTISGLTVCTEANGAHVATYVDATHLDLAAVTSVHTGADSGAMVLTAAPSAQWQAAGSILVTPQP